MGVLVKLKRLQEVLKRNGRMKLVYEELLDSKSAAVSEEHMTSEELEKELKIAKEAVIKAVMGGEICSLFSEGSLLRCQWS